MWGPKTGGVNMREGFRGGSLTFDVMVLFELMRLRYVHSVLEASSIYLLSSIKTRSNTLM